jgi:hypothetical protein
VYFHGGGGFAPAPPLSLLGLAGYNDDPLAGSDSTAATLASAGSHSAGLG